MQQKPRVQIDHRINQFVAVLAIVCHAGFMVSSKGMTHYPDGGVFAAAGIVLAILAVRLCSSGAAHVAAVMGLLELWYLGRGPLMWPFYLLVPVLLFSMLTACRVVPPLARPPIGKLDARGGLLILGASVVSGSAVTLWVTQMKPDLSTALDMLPALSPWLLVVGALLFSLGNAVLEEIIWRWIVLDGLRSIGFAPWLAVFTQALSFGFLHFGGFPSGPLGVGLATIFGLITGALRVHTRGLLVPTVAHILVDIVIFSLVAAAAHPTTAQLVR